MTSFTNIQTTYHENLVRKYNVPGPRYTSYPTVPYWDKEAPTENTWKAQVKKAFSATNSSEGISLYIHLPYCESLCTYCGCNTRITVNHAVEKPYMETLLKEWALYCALFDSRPVIRELHLGGGTPTFFSPENLEYLINGILETSSLHEHVNFGFEAHPTSTTKKHLDTLYKLGFRRLSLGIQDFDPKVQNIINRVQSYEDVAQATALARSAGYTSINYDLIYGLPLQTEASVMDTIRKVKQLQPDRIAFYSYAHVPWVKPGQRMFSKSDLPSDEAKRNLYEKGKAALLEAGYIEIGMDHFALPQDDLSIAFNTGKMHRNFMGYTPEKTHLLVGLGASAISDAWTGFIQNRKKVEDYMEEVHAGRIPFFRGHILNEEDLEVRTKILDLMCRFKTTLNGRFLEDENFTSCTERLSELYADGLIKWSGSQLHVTEKGKAFVRNVCMSLDLRLWRNEPEQEIFSSTV